VINIWERMEYKVKNYRIQVEEMKILLGRSRGSLEEEEQKEMISRMAILLND
jgi:hypothetical protein